VFYDLGIKLKLIINDVKLLTRIAYFIKGHFCMTFYSKNNENVTFITIFFVKIVTYENLRKLTKNVRKFKLK
jgi:hypothetical protein